MCEMISESCLVMVVIRQLRSFTSVPYYYESHSSPRAGLTRRPGPPSEIVDPAEFNGHPTADHGRLRGLCGFLLRTVANHIRTNLARFDLRQLCVKSAEAFWL